MTAHIPCPAKGWKDQALMEILDQISNGGDEVVDGGSMLVPCDCGAWEALDVPMPGPERLMFDGDEIDLGR